MSNIYNVLTGWLVTYQMTESGRRQIVHFLLPGDVLGYEPNAGMASIFGVQALTDSRLCTIPHRNLSHLVLRFPETTHRLLWLIGRNEALTYSHLTSMGQDQAPARIAFLFLELYVRAKRRLPTTVGDQVELPLTQTVVAEATGLTPIHVSRTLRMLREAGVVRFHERQLTILAPERLIKMSGTPEEALAFWITESVSKFVPQLRKR